MKTLLKIIFKPIFKRYYELINRIQELEIIVNTLLLDDVWKDEPQKYLNGQYKRQDIFLEIISKFQVTEVIETGTFIGRTTGYFAKYLPNAVIKTCELSPQYHQLAKKRLINFNNIEFVCSDSRKFLSNLSKIEKLDNNTISFIYLDAHWHSDLPLKEELEILSQIRRNAIIMIDDFQVLGDSGYNYDDYGTGKKLAFADYSNFFKKLGYHAFSPVASSNEETGKKRGCVILSLDNEIIKKLDDIAKIKKSL
jgi:predicted O-methyltransferase YrrM